jgi:hypothetical protein
LIGSIATLLTPMEGQLVVHRLTPAQAEEAQRNAIIAISPITQLVPLCMSRIASP